MEYILCRVNNVKIKDVDEDVNFIIVEFSGENMKEQAKKFCKDYSDYNVIMALRNTENSEKDLTLYYSSKHDKLYFWDDGSGTILDLVLARPIVFG